MLYLGLLKRDSLESLLAQQNFGWFCASHHMIPDYTHGFLLFGPLSPEFCFTGQYYNLFSRFKITNNM